MAKKERASTARNYSLMTYLDDETIKAVFLANSIIRHWAYITHDQDPNPDKPDEKKVAHRHILLNLNNSMTESAVRKLFPDSQNTFAQITKSKSACYDYLTHKDNPEKFQYDESLIVCDDPEYWKGIQSESVQSETFLNMLDDINAHVPLREMFKRYGRDFAVNYDKYIAAANRMRIEETPVKEIKDAIIFRDATQMQIIDPETGETISYHR